MGKYDKYKAGATFKKIPAQRIIAWIERHYEYKVRKGGAEYQICDPFDGDTNFRFQINPEMGVCNSWHGNDWAGPVNPKTGKRNCSFVRFVRVIKKCSMKDALSEILGDTGSVSLYLRPENRPGIPDVKRTVSVALPDGTRLLGPAEDRQANLLRVWLKSRGYNDESIHTHELYYIGMEVYWVFFEFDELVYWQSRSRINKIFRFPPTYNYDEEGKIISKTEGGRADYLYGFDDIEPASYIIITESIFDQYTLGKQTMASGGASLSPNQIKKLKLLGPKRGIILSPDNDIAGIKSIIANAKLLKCLNCPIFYSLLPSNLGVKDWNECITELGMSSSDVRQLHDELVKSFSVANSVKLRLRIRSKTH